MYAPSRRERRSDIIELLGHSTGCRGGGLPGLEADNVFLEGTAPWCWTMWAAWPTAQSHRANPVALERFAPTFSTSPWCFATADATGQPCYHTNVMLCIGTGEFAMGGFHMVSDPQRALRRGARAPVGKAAAT